MFVCCCFFFKQKTAYEMRISDWSSDVCSSDLLPHQLEDEAAPARRPLAAPPGDAEVDDVRLLARADEYVVFAFEIAVRDTRRVHRLERFEQALEEESGRASCRERVCQSV